MTSPRSLTALAEAQAALLAMLAPVAPREAALDEFLGLIAAESPPLAGPVPACALALRDGYALRAEDLAGASSYAPAILMQAPARVSAGDALPEGCDCVVDPVALDLSGPIAQAFVESYPGENVRRAAEDFAAGALVIEPGRRIGARHRLAAAAAGLRGLPVRQPLVRILPQGRAAEFVSNFLADLARENGARILCADESADLVLAVGDAPPQAEWLLRGLALEPGRESAVGRIAGAPAVFLPRTPDQAFAAFHALVRPALDRLTHRVAREQDALPLSAKIASRVGVAEIALMREEQGRFVPLAVGDLPLQSLARATHVALIPAESEGHAAGELFSAEPLSW